MGNPISTKDGVTVAKSIDLEDRVENIRSTTGKTSFY
jgi:hypothetical protein